MKCALSKGSVAYLLIPVIVGLFFQTSSIAPLVAAPIGSNEIKVVDGDTIRAKGRSYRLVDFDAPETGRAKCDAERVLGQKAKERLQQLVDAGGLDLTEIVCSCPSSTLGTRNCNYGRLCGRLTAHGEDVGAILIREKLARPFICGKTTCPHSESWCTTSSAAAPSPNCNIKGNVNRQGECIYHMPGGRYYESLKMDVGKQKRWFCSTNEAEAAGCRPSKN